MTSKADQEAAPQKTLGQLCEMLRGQSADDTVGQASIVSTHNAYFTRHFNTVGDAIEQFDTFGEQMPLAKMPDDLLEGKYALSLCGGNVTAGALLEALSRFLPKHADMPVLQSGARIVGIRTEFETDTVVFRETLPVRRDAAAFDRAIVAGRDLTEGSADDERVCAVMQAMVPTGWVLSVFRIGNRLLTNEEMRSAFPRLADGERSKLFKTLPLDDAQTYRLTAIMPSDRRASVTMHVAREGVTHVVLAEAYGPKRSKADRILEKIASAVAVSP